MYAQVASEAKAGIVDPAENFNAVFSGNTGEQNFWYQFEVVQRPGYIAPNPQFVTLLQSRNDPRLDPYFNADISDLNDALLSPNAPQPLVTANEDLLLWAEGLQRRGNDAVALAEAQSGARGRRAAGRVRARSPDRRCSPRS